MRSLIAFPCGEALLGGSVDAAPGSTGLLIATGGTQVRVGAHRGFAMLAAQAAARGYPAFRFDRRGVGDSGGTDPGFLQSGPDLAAALDSFRREQPQLRHVVGFGLCDGATALALNGGLGLDALVLANPWLVEAGENAPAPAAVRAHYRDRFRDSAAWSRLFRGGVNISKLLSSLRRAAVDTAGGDLAASVARGLDRFDGRITLVLSTGDNTARAARACWAGPAYRGLAARSEIVDVDTDAHTFARPGDGARLAKIVLDVLERVDAPSGG